MTEQTTIHIAIGNSDDKLTQRQWARYIDAVDDAIKQAAVEVHGRWYSAPDVQWQNAAWAFVLREDMGGEFTKGWLKARLGDIAKQFGQETIAWNESVTEFIEATK